MIEVSESGTCDGIGLPAVGVGTGLLGLATTGANESTVTGVDCGEGSVVHQQLVQMTAPFVGTTDGVNEGSLEMTIEGVSEGMELAKVARAVRVLFAPTRNQTRITRRRLGWLGGWHW